MQGGQSRPSSLPVAGQGIQGGLHQRRPGHTEALLRTLARPRTRPQLAELPVAAETDGAEHLMKGALLAEQLLGCARLDELMPHG